MSSPGPHRYGARRERSDKSARSETLFITCSALGKEVRAIIRKHQWDAEYVPVDSRYHLYPVKIEEAVKEKLLETDGNIDFAKRSRLPNVFFGESEELVVDNQLSRIDIQSQ